MATSRYVYWPRVSPAPTDADLRMLGVSRDAALVDEKGVYATILEVEGELYASLLPVPEEPIDAAIR